MVSACINRKFKTPVDLYANPTRTQGGPIRGPPDILRYNSSVQATTPRNRFDLRAQDPSREGSSPGGGVSVATPQRTMWPEVIVIVDKHLSERTFGQLTQSRVLLSSSRQQRMLVKT